MDERYSVEVDDLAPGAELDEEELRAIVGAQNVSRPLQASTCDPCGGDDCD
jgi:hypothetical protein